MRRRIGFSLLLLQLVSACGMSNADLQATTTQVAASLYGTQTALAPTEVSSLDRTAAATDGSSPTLAEEDVVLISRPTATPRTLNPLPPGKEPQLLCYKAASLIYVDWAVHDSFLHPYRPSNDWYGDRDNAIAKINQFNWYRQQRAEQITYVQGKKYELSNGGALYLDATYFLNGEDLDHCDQLGAIIRSEEFLVTHPWMRTSLRGVVEILPEGQTDQTSVSQIEDQMDAIFRVMRKMRYQLLVYEKIDYHDLMEVERPIWQEARDRFGVEIPNYLQGQEVDQ